MKLNLGCGNYILGGFDNIDEKPLNGVNTVSKIENLIQADNSVSEIYAGHIFEHLKDPLNELKRWYRWLEVGGILWIVVPERDMAIKAVKEGREKLFTVEQILCGTEKTGGKHTTIFTKSSLITLLKKADIKNFKVIDPPYNECLHMMSRIPWQLVIKIVKVLNERR